MYMLEDCEAEEVERRSYRAAKRFQNKIVRLEEEMQATFTDEAFAKVLEFADLHTQQTAAIQMATARYYLEKLQAVLKA